MSKRVAEEQIARGRFSQVWRLNCGACGAVAYFGKPPYVVAARRAELGGWRYERRRGWLCPDCVPGGADVGRIYSSPPPPPTDPE